jgi:hypothetical protein
MLIAEQLLFYPVLRLTSNAWWKKEFTAWWNAVKQ